MKMFQAWMATLVLGLAACSGGGGGGGGGGGTTTQSASCCLGASYYNCSSSAAATRCFNNSDTSGCSRDSSKDASCMSSTTSMTLDDRYEERATP